MQVLQQFSIPLKGLKIGHHEYKNNIDNAFFKELEQSVFEGGQISLVTKVEKKSDHLIFQLEFKGHISIDCDRCMDKINFPVDGTYEIILKYDLEEREEEDVVYIFPESTEYNTSKLIYDGILLSLPMHKTCDEVDNKECDSSVIDRLDNSPENNENTAFAEALKNLKL